MCKQCNLVSFLKETIISSLLFKLEKTQKYFFMNLIFNFYSTIYDGKTSLKLVVYANKIHTRYIIIL